MIQIPEIYQDIKLADYAPEFGEQTIIVRINPTRAMLAEMAALGETMREGITPEAVERSATLIAGLWQGWSGEAVLEMYTTSQETDPKFFEWLIYRTMTMIVAHRTQIKKN